MEHIYEYLIGGKKTGKREPIKTFAQLKKGDYYYVWNGVNNGDTIFECEFYEHGSQTGVLISMDGRVDSVGRQDFKSTYWCSMSFSNPAVIATSYEELLKVIEEKFNITGGFKLSHEDGTIV